MGASIRPVSPETHDDADFQAWKAAQTATPQTHDDADFTAWKAAHEKAMTNYDGSTAHAGVVPSALNEMTFGLSRKAIAAGGAGIAALKEAFRHPSENVAPIAEQAFRQNLGAQRAAADDYHEAHPWIDNTAKVVGGIGGIAATGGLGTGAEALQATRLGRMGKVIGTGAKYAAASAAGNSTAPEDGRGTTGLLKDTGKAGAIGAGVGLLSIPATAVAGKLAQWSGLPRLASGAAGSFADALPEGSTPQRILRNVSGALAPKGEASQIIAKRGLMDEQGGYTTPEPHPSLPPIALDRAGPNVEGLAEDIANKSGPGRAQIVKTMEGRQKLMRPAITNELEQGTGVKASDRLNPLQDALDARSTEAKQLYDKARAESAGQPINSETLEQIKGTKAGAAAFKVASDRQGNMFRPGGSTDVPPGMPPEQWELAKQAMRSRGIAVPEGVGSPTAAPPDPETLHIMRQHLAKMAKLGNVNDPMTAEAHSLLPLLDKVKGEMPASWQQADASYAERSRIIDMMDRGRNVFNTPINPASTGKKAVLRSLGGLDQKIAAASPEEQQAAQVGAATAAHAKLIRAPSSMKSPGTVMARSPEQVEQLGHAFPSPDKAADFQGAVSTWDRAQQQAERLTGNSRTALRGNLASDRDLVQPGALVSGRGPRMALRQVINGLNNEYESGKRQQLDGIISNILTSPESKALMAAKSDGTARSLLMQAIGRSAGGAAGELATQKH